MLASYYYATAVTPSQGKRPFWQRPLVVPGLSGTMPWPWTGNCTRKRASPSIAGPWWSGVLPRQNAARN